MLKKESHPSDQEMVQLCDGELSSRQSGEIRAHLAGCRECRGRMAALEGAMNGLEHAWRGSLDARLPSPDGPRALLRARMAALSATAPRRPRRFLPFAAARSAVLTASVAGLVAAVIFVPLAVRSQRAPTVPNPRLTPGAARAISVSQACSLPHEEVVADVSPSLRQEVLHEYGIQRSRSGEYEIDYLIAPGLGGTDDIHNLWPEPHAGAEWNSRVKDALEEHLHRMVCSREIDLPAAQRAITENWIDAYKRYFHTSRPLADHAAAEIPFNG